MNLFSGGSISSDITFNLSTQTLQGKTDESLDWDDGERRSHDAANPSSREYPLLSIVLGIATAIVLVILVIAAAMVVRCGGSSPSLAAVSGRHGAGGSWRDKHHNGSSSPDLLVQIESGSNSCCFKKILICL